MVYIPKTTYPVKVSINSNPTAILTGSEWVEDIGEI